MPMRSYNTPWRSLPYLGRDSFNEVFYVVIMVAMLLSFFLSGVDSLPAWTQTALKVLVGVIVFTDIMMRKMTFRFDVCDSHITYYCRGLFRARHNKIKLEDVDRVTIERGWHYRLLTLSSVEIYTVGSGSPVLEKVVLSKACENTLEQYIGQRGNVPSVENGAGTTQDDKERLVIPVWRVLLTPVLAPWRRSIRQMDGFVFVFLMLFISLLFATGGDVMVTADAMYSASQSDDDLNSLSRMAEMKMGHHLTEPEDVFGLCVFLMKFFVLLMLLARFTSVSSWKRLKTSVFKSGTYLHVKEGMIDLVEKKLDTGRLSEYQMDNGWINKLTGLTTIKLVNRDDGSEWHSPLLNKKELSAIVRWSGLPDVEGALAERPSRTQWGLRTFMAMREVLPGVIYGALLLLLVPVTDDLSVESLWVYLGAVSGVIMMRLCYSRLPDAYNAMVSQCWTFNGAMVVREWDDTPRICVFDKRESYCFSESTCGKSVMTTHYVGKCVHKSYRSIAA
mgnify:FL=1